MCVLIYFGTPFHGSQKISCTFSIAVPKPPYNWAKVRLLQMVRKDRKTCHILRTLNCLFRERVYIWCYVLNILSPGFPFLTVWLHLVIICILLKESVERSPLWRHYLISPPCGPLGEMWPGMLGKRKQKSGFSLRNATQRHGSQFRKEHGLSYVWCDWFLGKRVKFEVHCGAPAPGEGGSSFISGHPLFLIHTVGPRYRLVGVLSFFSPMQFL